MERETLGLSEVRVENRIKVEKQHAEKLAKVFLDMVERVKNTDEPNGWQRLVIFSNKHGLFEGLSPAVKTTLLYYLRRHPNITSKLSDTESSSVKANIKPYLYKWVSAEEKLSLGINANYFKHISPEILKYISENANTNYVSFVDILSVLEVFTSTRTEMWNEITSFDIVLFSGVPVENTRAALNELLRLKLLVFAYTEGTYRKGRLRQFVRLTATEEEYKEAIAGEGIDAVRIVSAKNVFPTNFKFTVLEYFFSLVGVNLNTLPKFHVDRQPIFADFKKLKTKSEGNLFPDTQEKTAIKTEPPKIIATPKTFETVPEFPAVSKVMEDKVAKVSNAEKIPEVTENKIPAVEEVAEVKVADEKISLPVEENKPVAEVEKTSPTPAPAPTPSIPAIPQTPPVVVKEVVEKVSPELTQAVNEIKGYMTSFADIAKSIYKNEEKKFTAIDSLLSANAKQREENEELKKQIEGLKKIVNRQERDKHAFVKKVQDSLNMMMGQIISATDEFARTPRHLMNESTVQTHKADVIKIAVQTAYDIQKVIATAPSTSNNSR